MRSIYRYIIVTFLYIVCHGISSFGQEGTVSGGEKSLKFPLNLSPSISGSYGELRSNHFHLGVDFRIGGSSGASLYAANDGYISRITVSPSGYGRAIYIVHPNGLTTIYAHMHNFASKIEEYVQNEQYRRESFAVDLSLDPTVFEVKRGELIGEAGNSGSSVAPHLHFEVRDTKSQNTVNPLKMLNLSVKDNLAPVFEMVNFYSIQDADKIPSRSLIASYKGATTNLVEVSDSFYVAVAAADRQNGTPGKLAVHSYKYFLDDELIFSLTPDPVAAGMGRYINSMIEYSERQRSGRNFMIKSWIEPACGLMSNIEAKDSGLFILNDDDIHKVRIELWDEHGNMAEREFRVKRQDISSEKTIDEGQDIAMYWFLDNEIRESDFRYFLGWGSLYSSVYMNLRRDTLSGYTGWRLHNGNTPLHRPAKISLKSDIPESLKDKALIAIVNDSGRLTSLGGAWNGGWIETESLSFGLYTVALDTIAPGITSSFKEGATLKGRATVRFTIRDNLSGIDSYKVYIDDKWVLADYDAKNNRLTVPLNTRTAQRDKKHRISVEVTDRRGNINQLKSSFIW